MVRRQQRRKRGAVKPRRGMSTVVAIPTRVPRRAKRSRNRRSKGKVGSALTRGMTMGGRDFIRASLDPFADVQLSGIGVPDKFGGNTLKFRQYMTTTVKPDSNGGAGFAIVPCVDGMLMPTRGSWNFQIPNTLTKTVVNQSIVYGTATVPSLYNNLSLGIIPFPEWAQWAAANINASGTGNIDSNSPNPYSINDYRIAGMAVEIRYTGTTLTNSGMIYGARIEADVKGGRLPFTASNGTPVNGTDNNWPGIKYLRQIDSSSISANTSQDVSNIQGYVAQEVRQGCLAVATNQTGSWDMTSYDPNTLFVSDTASFIMDDKNSTTVGMFGIGGVTATPHLTTVPVSAWAQLSPMVFAIEGLDPAGTLEVRVIQYVEATSTLRSPFQQFTTKSPAEDPGAMMMVATVSKTLPAMVPVSMNSFGDWWKKIMGVISRIGGAVGGMGIPVVSQIAGGVGVISDVLGSFASI